jgi:hypothetical protein
MRAIVRALTAVSMSAACLAPCAVADAAEAGDVVVVDNIGVPLYTHNFDSGKDTGVGDELFISEFIGAHYFITSKLRMGVMVQWTEQYTGTLAAGSDRFSTFALLPQIGWNVSDHFSATAVFSYAPRAMGEARLDLGVQALLGYGFPVTQNARVNLLLEVPYNFRLARTIGITPLMGLTMQL